MTQDNSQAQADKKRILLVDDEKDITESLTINLEATGKYVVHTVNDPRQAVSEARNYKPDIVILDVVMPKMDGGDVQSAIRSDPQLKDVPIILVTALLSNDEIGGGAREASGDYMLAKPVRLPVLVNLIDQRIEACSKG